MTTEQQAEILRVLQGKYGVLKSFIVRSDCISNVTCVGNIPPPDLGLGSWDFNHGIVLDALWDWIVDYATEIDFDREFPAFNVYYEQLNERSNLEKFHFLANKRADSENKWLIAEWILQQEGELK